MRGNGLSLDNSGRTGALMSGPAALPASRKVARATRTAVAIVAIYLLAKMFYVAKGGKAQPADIMICLLAFFIVPPRTMLELLKSEIALTALVVWVALVNLVWFMVTTDPGFLPPILYFVFNLMIVLTFFGVRRRDPVLFDRTICLTIILAIAIQSAAVLAERFGLGAGLRNVGTFRNPNQLAYWGVLMLSIFLLLRRSRLGRIDKVAVGAVVFCEFASASRAGLAALAALLAIWLYFALASGPKRIFACLGVAAVGIVLSLSPVMDRVLVATAENSAVGTRLAEVNSVSQFDQRQYDRIIEFYQYTAFGAGEGYLSRFVEDGVYELEIHSSFGTMLFSYGIPGLTLFLLLLLSAYRKLPTSLGLYLLPSLVYGVTHQGLRFTPFWALIGVAFAVGDEFRRNAAVSRALTPRRQREARGPGFLRRRALAASAGRRQHGVDTPV